MLAKRVVLREILDSLAPEDPAAIWSRRDLKRVNRVMGNARVLAGHLKGRSPRRILEIGAGDGSLMLQVARLIGPLQRGPCLTLLDRQAVVPVSRKAEFASLGWGCESVTADAFDSLRTPTADKFDVICANLFLHHFESQALTDLLRLAAERTEFFIACEPRRSVAALATCSTLWAIGCNHVTRHDARVSVRAGFRGQELSSLWPRPQDWLLKEEGSFPFSHVFVAERRRSSVPSTQNGSDEADLEASARGMSMHGRE